MASPVPERHRRRWGRGGVVVGILVALLLAESAVRALGDRLPEPQRWSTPETQYKVGQIGELTEIDTVAIGSSVVDVALDPAQLDRRAYNAALGAASIGVVDVFAREVVLPELEPDVVVVGLSSRELNVNSREQRSTERDFLDAPAMRQRLGTESVLDRLERIGGDAFHLVRYRSVLRDPDMWFDSKPAWDGTVTGDSGLYLDFLDKAYHAGPRVLRSLRNGPLRDFAIGDEQLATLRALLRHLHEVDRRVLLVATPVTRDYVDAYPRGVADHELFLATIGEVAAELGIELVDAGVWPTSLMSDPLHANQAGVERFTALVADALG